MTNLMASGWLRETTQQCSARAKSTGIRCQRPAIPGATVCFHHGGAAGQVRKAAKRRLALGEAMADLNRPREVVG